MLATWVAPGVSDGASFEPSTASQIERGDWVVSSWNRNREY